MREDYTAPAVAAEASPLDEYIDSIDTRRYPGAFTSDKQAPYAFSPLSGSKVEQDAEENPDRLYNARKPHYAITHERAEHRVILYLKAEGHSNAEIARMTGFSAVAISNIVRQPWAQETILKILREAGGDAVQNLLQGAAADSVMRLITERDNDNARPEARIQAADKLLDRLYGKPNQPIEHRQQDLTSLDDKDLERIAANGSASCTTTATSS